MTGPPTPDGYARALERLAYDVVYERAAEGLRTPVDPRSPSAWISWVPPEVVSLARDRAWELLASLRRAADATGWSHDEARAVALHPPPTPPGTVARPDPSTEGNPG